MQKADYIATDTAEACSERAHHADRQHSAQFIPEECSYSIVHLRAKPLPIFLRKTKSLGFPAG